MNNEKIGEFIKQKRKEKNLTQSELGEKINVTDKAISKWERGLGCPDISLLESLSNELDITILELLNGEEINEEQLKIKDANDLVKNTINYSNDLAKNKIKNIFNRILEISILFIVALLVFLNVIQYKYMDKEYTYSINRDSYVLFKDTLSNINKNIEEIKNNKTIFNDEDYKIIINNLEIDNNKVNNIYYLRKVLDNKTVKYKIIDLRLLTDMFYVPGTEIDLLKILDKYTDSDLIKTYTDFSIRLLSNTSRSQRLYNKVIDSYYYNISYNNPSAGSVRVSDLGDLNSNLETRLNQFLFLTELVKEVGGLNE